jgi:hypothetical protein
LRWLRHFPRILGFRGGLVRVDLLGYQKIATLLNSRASGRAAQNGATVTRRDYNPCFKRTAAA